MTVLVADTNNKEESIRTNALKLEAFMLVVMHIDLQMISIRRQIDTLRYIMGLHVGIDDVDVIHIKARCGMQSLASNQILVTCSLQEFLCPARSRGTSTRTRNCGNQKARNTI